MLVDACVYQMGASKATRAVEATAMTIRAVDSSVIKVMVFRDQVEGDWSQVCQHPLKHIFDRIPVLRACQDPQCTGCEEWHTAPNAPLQHPVLELWGRQWMTVNFSATAPAQAEVFAVNIRIPSCLKIQIQTYSGLQGIYIEPKAVDGRKPSLDFQVVWIPRADWQQARIQQQTLPSVIGLPRLGMKYGLRCKAHDAAELFKRVRPGHVFLPPGPKKTYLVGPFQYGSLKESVAEALASIGWTARPTQPIAAGAHVQGLMFRVQATEAPPRKVIHMQHGDVLITAEDANTPAMPAGPQVVGVRSTVSLCAAAKASVDPLQIQDPWATKKVTTQQFHLGDPIADLEQRVTEAVMSKLPSHDMEIDDDPSRDSRIATLEAQMQEMQQQQQSLSQVVQAQHVEHTQQIHKLGQAVESNTAQITSFQEAFQEQFQQQVAHQQQQLDGMLGRQMHQFEAMLARHGHRE